MSLTKIKEEIMRKFSKDYVLKRLSAYKNWEVGTYVCPVTGKTRTCYVAHVLTQFESSYEEYPVVARVILDVEYVDGKRLSGGLYCEGQDYIHLTRTEVWSIKKNRNMELVN